MTLIFSLLTQDVSSSYVYVYSVSSICFGQVCMYICVCLYVFMYVHQPDPINRHALIHNLIMYFMHTYILLHLQTYAHVFHTSYTCLGE